MHVSRKHFVTLKANEWNVAVIIFSILSFLSLFSVLVNLTNYNRGLYSAYARLINGPWIIFYRFSRIGFY